MATIECDIRCLVCGAELRGVDGRGECPLCRSSVDKTLGRIKVDPDRLELKTDLTCVGCGYNLRALPIASRCPECFRPIVLSLRANELDLADPKWLRKVRGGVETLLVVMIGTACLAVFGLGLFVQIRSDLVLAILLCLWVTFYVCFAIGVFRATTNESSKAAPRTFDASRFVARALVFSPFFATPFVIVTMAGSLALVFARLRVIALRGAARTLTVQCTWTVVLLLPGSVVSFAGWVLAAFAPAVAGDLGMWLVYIGGTVLIIAAVVSAATLVAARWLLSKAIDNNRFAYTPAASAGAEQR